MRRTVWLVICAVALACAGVTSTNAQQPRGGRPLAQGVLTVIPMEPVEEETFSGPLPIVEIIGGHKELAWNPGPNFTPLSNTLYEKAKLATLRRTIWNLEFTFKPLRMVAVDIPQASGKMQRKTIWYMVYRVRYLGDDYQPKPVVDQQTSATTFPDVDKVSVKERRFLPHFVLENRELDKAYLSRLVPSAKIPILLREFPSRVPGRPAINPDQLYDTVAMTSVGIPLAEQQANRGVWGVVTWEDVDPRIDYFSIYIQGLTNAYQFADAAGVYQPGDPPGTGRSYAFKTLQLNFWRAGDEINEHEREIRFGVPILESTESAMAASKSFDTNGDGEVLPGEVPEARRAIVEHWKRLTDKDQDNVIDISEFSSVLPSTQAQVRVQERIFNQFGWLGMMSLSSLEDDSAIMRLPVSLDMRDTMTVVALVDRLDLNELRAAADQDLARELINDVIYEARNVEHLRRTVKLPRATDPIETLIEGLQAIRAEGVKVIQATFSQPNAQVTGVGKVETLGSQWSLALELDGQQTQVRARMEPEAEYWTYTDDGLTLKRRLDYLWIYR